LTADADREHAITRAVTAAFEAVAVSPEPAERAEATHGVAELRDDGGLHRDVAAATRCAEALHGE